jgi:hypothetical protein
MRHMQLQICVVACDKLHATLRMQHVCTVLIYMFIHTYQSNVVAPYVQLSLQLHTTYENMTHV